MFKGSGTNSDVRQLWESQRALRESQRALRSHGAACLAA